MKHLFIHVKIWFIFVELLFSLGVRGQGDEYLMKAGFIEKFTRFVEWTPQYKQLDTFYITIIGDNPFGYNLEQIFKDITVQGKPPKIRYINKVSQLDTAHLVFISNSLTNNYPSIVDSLRYKPVLIISEIDGFAQKGGHINFYITTQQTIHFEINPENIKQSGLKIDMYLLDFAKIVEN